MASLIDVSDTRLIILHNNGADLMLFNQGYQRDPGALTFQNYSIDGKKGVLTLGDTFLASSTSDLKLLVTLRKPLLGILNLCKNGAARDGFLMHGVKFNPQDSASSKSGYNNFKLRCRGGYRKLSKSELLRGSRFSATQA